jgi:DNA primase
MTMGAEGRAPAGARTADDWVERVRAASDIVEVIGQTVSLKRVGRNWMGLCPFHQEKTPSFSVNAERQFYHCFSCKVGGDVFKFVQETERVGFLEAVELLSRRAGIPVPERRAGGVSAGAKGRLLEALEAAATAYEQWLWDPGQGGSARRYLESRGLSRETIRAFRLGVSPAGWDHLANRLHARFPEDVLVDAGLAMRREAREPGARPTGVYDRFRNRLMVPLIATPGSVVGFGARALAADDQPKYLNSPETPAYHKGAFLFALDAARRVTPPDGELIVVEGYFDAIALHQAGLANTVATSGTALTPDQARLLRRVAPRVALTYDGDRAGQDAMLRSLGVLLGEGLDVAVVDLPAGEDPDTLVRRGGLAGWNALRAAAADPVEFVQRHVLRAGAAGDPRERALQTIVALGAAIADPIRLDLLAERAERVLAIPSAVLRRAVALRRTGRDAAAPLGALARRQRTAESDLERALLRALLAAPAALEPVRQRIGPDDFRDPACAALARSLWSGEPGAAGDEAEALARELLGTADESLDWAAEADGAARRLVVRRLKHEQREAELQLRRATDAIEIERLMKSIQSIAHSLKDLS